jgi:hypothetical protein
MDLSGLSPESGLCRTAENKHSRTTADLISDTDLCGLVYLDAVQIGAIDTAQILEQPAIVLLDQLGMATGNRNISQDNTGRVTTN